MLEEVWGRRTCELFDGRTHRAFYEDAFRYAQNCLSVEEGQSHERLETYPDRYFDVLYIDADHEYEAVRRDADVAVRKIRQDGLLLFNDYTLYDHLTKAPYGVVQAVNELIVATDWKVIRFSFQRYLYCDIALRRIG